MHKSGVVLTLRNEKTNKVLFEVCGRKSKVIRLFLIHSIKEKEVLKADIINIIWNTMQFDNVWDMWKQRNKQEKERDEDAD